MTLTLSESTNLICTSPPGLPHPDVLLERAKALLAAEHVTVQEGLWRETERWVNCPVNWVPLRPKTIADHYLMLVSGRIGAREGEE